MTDAEDTYRFWSWDGQELSITVPAGTPVSARSLHDRTNHRPFALNQARNITSPRFQLLVHGRRGHELVAEEVNCAECLTGNIAPPPVDDERDPRIDAAEYERLSPEVETGPDYRHWHYPDPKWHD